MKDTPILGGHIPGCDGVKPLPRSVRLARSSSASVFAQVAGVVPLQLAAERR